jgi:uncharacterized membrane protein YkoI
VIVRDGDKNDTKEFNVTVSPVNDAPILETNLTTKTISEDSPTVAYDVNVSDIDNDDLNITITASVPNKVIITKDWGNTLINKADGNQTFTITPVKDATGSVDIIVQVTDEGKEHNKTVTITIDPVNDAPILESNYLNISMYEDNDTTNYEVNVSDVDFDNLTVTVESNDSDILTVSKSWSNPLSSSEYLQDFNLTTIDDASGIVKITVTVSDALLQEVKEFNVTVTAVKDEPVIHTNYPNLFMQEENGTTNYELNVSDVDSNSLTIRVESNDTSILRVTENWSGSLNSTEWFNSFNLSTQLNASGLVSITVKVSDGELNTSEEFNVTVEAVNDGPSLDTNITNITILEDSGASTYDVKVSDIDTDELNITITASVPNMIIINKAWGNTLVSKNDWNQTFTLTPVANATGTVNITVSVTDDGGLSQSKMKTITLSPINDTPSIDTTFSTIIIDEDNGQSQYEVNVSDVDLDNLTLIVESNNSALISSSITWNNPISDGEYTGLIFTLNTQKNAYGTAQIKLTLSDDDVNVTQVFDVVINAVNDKANIDTNLTNLTLAEDSGSYSYEVNVSDVDNTGLSISIESNNTDLIRVSKDWSGELNASNWRQEFNLTIVDNTSGIAKITLSVTDGTSTTSKDFNITVSPLNDKPSIDRSFSNIIINEDMSIPQYELNVSDIDLDNLSLTVESNNTAVIMSQITWVNPISSSQYKGLKFNLNTKDNTHGLVQITVTLSDTIETVSKTFTVTVNSVNDIPSSEDKSFIIDENQVLSFSANDFKFIDIEVSTGLNSIIITSLPIAGTLSLNGTAITLNQNIPNSDIGNITYTPAPTTTLGVRVPTGISVLATDMTYAIDFSFKVNDGESNALSTNTISVDIRIDTDNDGLMDNVDTDDDNDGTVDANDALPYNPNEQIDTDGDGIGNNADTDDDNDGIIDSEENLWGFDPLDPSDGGDADADGDGVSNKDEIDAGSNPLDSNETEAPVKKFVPIMLGDIFIMIPVIVK